MSPPGAGRPPAEDGPRMIDLLRLDSCRVLVGEQWRRRAVRRRRALLVAAASAALAIGMASLLF